MRPSRELYPGNRHTYFISTQTWGRRSLFQSERFAKLLCEVVRHYDPKGYALHAFVVMPDHLHCLLTPTESLEKAVQLIKGGFSFRAKRELQSNVEIWQPGFTDHRIRDEENWEHHVRYLKLNPVEAHLVQDSTLYPWMGFPAASYHQGLKPRLSENQNVRAEARTLHQNEH